jgi:hypothetical protein
VACGGEVVKTLLTLAALVFTYQAHASDYTIIVGSASGGYASHARVVSKHLPKHLGGSSVSVKSVPGASGLNALNYLTRQETVGTIEFAHIQTPAFVLAATRHSGVMFEVQDLQWIGAASSRMSSPYILFSKEGKDLVVGSVSSLTSNYAAMVLKTTNLTFKEVSGYQDVHMIRSAFESGEITGAIIALNGVRSTSPQWLSDPSIRPLLQMGVGFKRHALFADTPTWLELSKATDATELILHYESLLFLDRGFVLPKAATATQVGRLRDAFGRLFQDKEYLDDAKRLGVVVDPVSHIEIKGVVDQIVKYSGRNAVPVTEKTQ